MHKVFYPELNYVGISDFPFLDYIIPQLRQKVNPFFEFLRFAQKFLEQLGIFVQNAGRHRELL